MAIVSSEIGTNTPFYEYSAIKMTGYTVNALNGFLVPSIDVSAYRWFSLQITGTWSGTLTFYGSNDNVNFTPIFVAREDYNNMNFSNTTVNGIFVSGIGFQYLAVQATGWSSGTANAVLILYVVSSSLMMTSVQASTFDANGNAWYEGQNTMNRCMPVTLGTDQPPRNVGDVLPLQASNVGTAGAATSATLTPTSGKTAFLRQVYIGVGIPTAAVATACTITGTGTTLSFELSQSLTAGAILYMVFEPPLSASATNTNIVVTHPAIVNGGVVSVTAIGFQK